MEYDCFISTIWRKNSFFPSIFPLDDSPAEVFYRLSLWNFKKCSIKHFLMMQPKKWSALAIFFQRKKACIIVELCKMPIMCLRQGPLKGKGISYGPAPVISLCGMRLTRYFIGYPFGASRNAASSISL